ncbi:hypothetical protein K432DRAFT_303465 [Lepidopterella palustris CBS 459.81]|uniref:Uncharacterized protein n=1 Tax=Lepidopterella palustris CBS 459.81 TaxID=1314670 RepID=A0A8E2E5I0_9PEZI|nr:hypothetical protein K432DRAFT_303465 [Lepidopterella palustris CBS 459.81]
MVTSTPPILDLPTATPSKPFRHTRERLSMPLDQRLALSASMGFLCGLILGSSHGGRMAGLRFRAENAHRLPDTANGWFMYHKSKNYYRMRWGLREGVRKGAMLAVWVGVFFVCEESVDVFRGTWRRGWESGGLATGGDGFREVEEKMRGSRDFVSTVCAGLGTSGLWSLYYKFPLPTAVRTAKLGLVVGLGFGLVQDAMALVKGQRVGYVDRIKSIRSNYAEWKDQREKKMEAKMEEQRKWKPS